MMRFLATLMLALVLPVQAGAAACAQLCTSGAIGHADVAGVSGQRPGDARAAQQDAAGEDTLHGHPCDKPTPSAKCCQGHGVMAHAALNVPSVVVPAFDRVVFVARWASFIPEEPSPPPIAPTRR